MNEIQRRFDALCKLGGGTKGGPARTKVQDLLSEGGKRLNVGAFSQTTRARDRLMISGMAPGSEFLDDLR